jgi:DNA-binding response OmpR family regulator
MRLANDEQRSVSTAFVRCTSLAQGTVQSYLESLIPLDNNPQVVREIPPVVLVVEDDSALRQPLVKFLRMRQYTVVAAETGEEGVAAVKSHQPAAVIVDLNLHNGSGRDVVAAVPVTTPLIIFSNQRAATDDLEARPLTRVVGKPYSLIMLMDTLQDMLEPSRRSLDHQSFRLRAKRFGGPP